MSNVKSILDEAEVWELYFETIDEGRQEKGYCLLTPEHKILMSDTVFEVLQCEFEGLNDCGIKVVIPKEILIQLVCSLSSQEDKYNLIIYPMFIAMQDVDGRRGYCEYKKPVPSYEEALEIQRKKSE